MSLRKPAESDTTAGSSLVLSRNLERVSEPATIAMTARARALSAEGRSVISMSFGEPDFDVPENIKDAAIAAIRHGENKYTPVAGIPALRAAIVQKFRRENSLEYSPSQTIASAGGKQIIFNAMAATLNAGDEVVISAPYWVSYPDIVTFCGATPVFVETAAARQFKLRADDLEAAITPRTRWLVINSPTNPTGSLYGRSDLEEIAQVLLRHPHVWILSDDMYEHIIYVDEPFRTIAAVEPRLLDRTLTMNGLSKAYAMMGWRLGYAAGPLGLIEAMEKAQVQQTSAASVIAQWAAVEALNGDQSVVAVRRAEFRRRRDLVVGLLRDVPLLDCQVPDGAFYAFPSCARAMGRRSPTGLKIASDDDFALELLGLEGVSVVPGSAFGTSSHFRVSFAGSDPQLEEACLRIKRFCAALG